MSIHTARGDADQPDAARTSLTTTPAPCEGDPNHPQDLSTDNATRFRRPARLRRERRSPRSRPRPQIAQRLTPVKSEVTDDPQDGAVSPAIAAPAPHNARFADPDRHPGGGPATSPVTPASHHGRTPGAYSGSQPGRNAVRVGSPASHARPDTGPLCAAVRSQAMTSWDNIGPPPTIPKPATGIAALPQDLQLVIIAALTCVPVALYLLPTIVALLRRADNLGAVLTINLFTGWTIVGWITAMASACTSRRRQRHGAPPVATSPRPGWYRDPLDPQHWWWWDGRRWTASVRFPQAPPSPTPPPAPSRGQQRATVQ